MLKTDARNEAAAGARAAALCVSLEDTVLLADLRFELLLRILRTRPAEVWRLPFWLFASNVRIGSAVSGEGGIDWRGLPVDQAVVRRLGEGRAAGRQVVLVSSFDQRTVDQIAATLGISDMALGSDDGVRRSDADALGRKFPHGFEMVSAAGSEPSPRLGRLRSWLRTLRVHQWAKNLLVFVPVFLEGPHMDVPKLTAALLALVMLSCFASAGYIVNDIVDVDADRRSHQAKRSRPFASGRVRTRYGLLAVPLIVCIGCVAGLLLPAEAFGLGCIYLVSSILYSLWLKRVPMLDVVVLAWLFTIRILVGIFGADLVISYWLLTFSMFFFLNLAIIKRYAELVGTPALGTAKLERRGYSAMDMSLLLAMGSGSALAAASIFVSYLLNEQFPKNIYATPASLWLIFPVLLFWMLRAWHETIHGRMNMDPVLFALRDPVSQLLGVIVAVCLWLAW